MKNFSKTIAAISMSLLTVGAIAQMPADLSGFRNTNPVQARGKFITLNPSQHKVSSGPTSYFLADNLNGDEVLTGGTFFNWSPFLYLNTKFTNKDTLTSNCANSVTSVYDVLWDFYTQQMYELGKGTAVVDTIECEVRYHNTSGKNDTIILSVNSVTAAGYPGVTVYGVDTVVVVPGVTFTNNTLDSVAIFSVIKDIPIPASARHGWNFGVQMTVHADKTKDSIALLYFSQGSSACAALGGSYTPEPTAIGVANGAVAHVNTFLTGEWAYNSPGVHGNGTMLSWPLTSGAQQGFYQNSGGYYYAPLPLAVLSCCASCSGDTTQFAAQDLGMFVSVHGVDATGINEVKATGLYVGQNYPNPFNKETSISYSLTKSSTVTFTVCDITGRVVTTTNYGNVAAGKYQINLAANTFSPGIYFYTFNVDGSAVTNKMVVTQ